MASGDWQCHRLCTISLSFVSTETQPQPASVSLSLVFSLECHSLWSCLRASNTAWPAGEKQSNVIFIHLSPRTKVTLVTVLPSNSLRVHNDLWQAARVLMEIFLLQRRTPQSSALASFPVGLIKELSCWIMPREQTSHQVHEFIQAGDSSRAPSYWFFTQCFSVSQKRKWGFPLLQYYPWPHNFPYAQPGALEVLLDESDGGRYI